MSISLLLTFILLLICCSKKENVVAEFDEQKITLDEFRLAYLEVLKQPDVFDSSKLRGEFLDELINRRLIAVWADKNEPKDEADRLRIHAYRDKCLREAHYREFIEPQVMPDTALLDSVYAFSTQRRKIRHLIAPTREEAVNLYLSLQNGEDWNKLSKEVFRDDKLAVSGGDLGWVNWDQLEYDMAMTAFRQAVGTYSKPVKSSFGWHIIFTENSEMNPLLSEMDLKMHRGTIRNLVGQRIGDKIASDNIAKTMAAANIQIHTKIMQFVGAQVGALLTREPGPMDKIKDAQLTDHEQKLVEKSLWDYRNEVLAVIDGKEMTVAWFMGELNYIPYQALYKSYKTALDFALRDFVITEQAKAANLDRIHPFVQQKTRIFSDYLTQLRIRRGIVQQSHINDDDLRAYYKANSETLFKSVPFDSIKAQIEPLVQNYKQRENVTRFIQELRSKVKISKNESLIHDFYNQVLDRS